MTTTDPADRRAHRTSDGCDAQVNSGIRPQPRRPPSRLIAIIVATGFVIVVLGLLIWPWLVALGAFLILTAPFGFLLASPPPERKYDLIGDAMARPFGVKTSSSRSRERQSVKQQQEDYSNE